MNRLEQVLDTLKANLLIGEQWSIESTLNTLRKLRKNREDLVTKVSRKRSWSPSEKAAASADFMAESQAITVALNAIEILQREGNE